MKNRFPYLFATVAALAAVPACAEVRAVIVGVSDYLTLNADLKGPAFDAALMAETLVARGVQASDMVVLTATAQGLPDGVVTGQPVRAKIIAAMQAVAVASQPGDTVVFYFSGHGSQAPDISGDEGGGYDEILLPADAAGWKGATGSVENAILDDELQAWAQGMLTRGVAVVGLVDACHSATGFRAIGGTGVARVLPPEALGIPEDVEPMAGVEAAPLTGDFVFLYSSQSDQRSFEYPLGDGVTWHGEFTLRLSQVLRTAPEASWAQVLAATSDAMAQGPARQMPEGEGTLLDARVFGEGSAMVRMPVKADLVKAGLLQGLTTGSEVAVYAAASGGEPLATLTVGAVTAREAKLSAVVPEGALWAELVSLAPPSPLTLATPVRANAADGFDYRPWIAALPAGATGADLVPILTGGVVALAGADGVLDPEGPGSTPRIALQDSDTPSMAVERMLTQAAHGLRLRDVLAGASGRSLTGKAALSMLVERKAAGADCGDVAAPVQYDPAKGVQGCDQLWLVLTNTGGKAQDVSVLYFGVDFAVSPIWPTQNLANRLAPGESIRVGLQIEPTDTAGLEEIWVLAVPVDPNAPRVDLTRLASPQMTRDFAGASDAMTLWLEGRMGDPDEAKMRGFTIKPAPLTMLRQVVRLKPGTL
jgi:metacaspase-1